MDFCSASTSSTPTQYKMVERDPTGRYVRFAEILGEGASKMVYKAFDEVDGIEVAWNQNELSEDKLKSGKQLERLCAEAILLKSLKDILKSGKQLERLCPEATLLKSLKDTLKSGRQLERLCAEATLLKSLKHENVIRCFHSWVDTQNKTINMITELFTSGDLRLYRNKHGHLDNKAIKKWARQILQGLAHLHSPEPPIVHRDLKYENFFVNGYSGKFQIGDLGLASVLQHATAHSILGTPEFMGPELYDAEYDERADI